MVWSLSLPSHQRGSDMPPHKYCHFGILFWAQVTWETTDARGALGPAPLSLRVGRMISGEKSALKAPVREALFYHWRLGVIPKLNRYKQPKQPWSSTRFPHLFPGHSPTIHCPSSSLFVLSLSKYIVFLLRKLLRAWSHLLLQIFIFLINTQCACKNTADPEQCRG